MIKLPGTALLEAMNALPFFDPLMDTGTAPSESSFDPRQNLSSDDICAIMDKLLQLEVSKVEFTLIDFLASRRDPMRYRLYRPMVSPS
jgi:hypothetical protein